MGTVEKSLTFLDMGLCWYMKESVPIYLAVGFPHSTVKYYNTKRLIEDALYPIYKEYGIKSEEYKKEKERLEKEHNFDHKTYVPYEVILAASLDLEDVDRDTWDSEGGYYDHVLICKSDLPFNMHDWEEEIKWLKMKEEQDDMDLFFSAAKYEEIEKPIGYRQISGFGL